MSASRASYTPEYGIRFEKGQAFIRALHLVEDNWYAYFGALCMGKVDEHH
jgi:hypothetical protein